MKGSPFYLEGLRLIMDIGQVRYREIGGSNAYSELKGTRRLKFVTIYNLGELTGLAPAKIVEFCSALEGDIQSPCMDSKIATVLDYLIKTRIGGGEPCRFLRDQYRSPLKGGKGGLKFNPNENDRPEQATAPNPDPGR